ncbi:uncharacterized protein I206_101071 [Kwoniella pini CBS 10737]|uniref:Uncharacterized protein n=1 Tax=Kwoniella pini CBS 10737 TaxID=1296096 RepID=A0A1B9IC03_9TREE|nr:uncharacterized protein I206_00255 [Kwoniella pini CBS 10737]OCF52954.1 hypothetical protein I206_00255 [Kwoniella pini CBS 10737]
MSSSSPRELENQIKTLENNNAIDKQESVEHIATLETGTNNLKTDQEYLAKALKDYQSTKINHESQLEVMTEQFNKLNIFVNRIKSAHEKYKKKYGTIHLEHQDYFTAQIDDILVFLDQNPRNRTIKEFLKRMKIEGRLNWSEHWFKLIEFALKDLYNQ